jgi:hypothetical protein
LLALCKDRRRYRYGHQPLRHANRPSRMTSLELACSRVHSDDTAGRTGQAPAGFPERDGRKLSQNGVHVLCRKYDQEGLKFCGVATTNPTPEYRFSQCHVTLATAQSLLEAHPKSFRRSCLCFTLSWLCAPAATRRVSFHPRFSRWPLFLTRLTSESA